LTPDALKLLRCNAHKVQELDVPELGAGMSLSGGTAAPTLHKKSVTSKIRHNQKPFRIRGGNAWLVSPFL
jgi:hypothetical protein